MTNAPVPTFDWAASRGEKWRSHLPHMEAMLAPIDEPLVRLLRLDAPVRIADIACGGGGTTLELQRQAPRGSVVHGFDIAPALTEAARLRAQAEGSPVVFTTADVAATLPPGPPYQRLASRFGVMFFDDPPAAFLNLARWLVPGGRFAFAVWGPPADNAWVATVRDVVAEFVQLPAPVPDAPGPFRYGQPDGLTRLLATAGFEEVQVNHWRGRLVVGGGLAVADAAAFVLAAFSVAEHLAHADEDTRTRAQHRLIERFEPFVQDGVVHMHAHVQIVTGVRAG